MKVISVCALCKVAKWPITVCNCLNCLCDLHASSHSIGCLHSLSLPFSHHTADSQVVIGRDSCVLALLSAMRCSAYEHADIFSMTLVAEHCCYSCS